MGDIELQIFSERLKKLRTELEMTQKDFAEKISVTSAALSAYENNQKNPSVIVAKRIAQSFNVSIDWLCGLSDNQQGDLNSVRTYADVIEICMNTKNPVNSIHVVINSFEEYVKHFLQEFEHMNSLKQNGTIDQELFNLWLDKTLDKYRKDILLGLSKKKDGK